MRTHVNYSRHLSFAGVVSCEKVKIWKILRHEYNVQIWEQIYVELSESLCRK